jgi:hypothetical protein
MLKKIVMLIGLVTISMLVAADCAQDCQDEYTKCMHDSQSTAKSKICGELLRECKLQCAMDGE